eukprot:TRINITY_DN5790_c0_g1_i11.p1 TRINITY_DN5790_c0_g1~~TRINITY_DN5790_c0_g1_i11.p1  ORF type:complete len:118 (-),score=8.59 TRINITY_DN5790_c0_g1_i11:55-408(-)
MKLVKYNMKALEYGVDMAKQRHPYSSLRGHETDPSEFPTSSLPQDRRLGTSRCGAPQNHFSTHQTAGKLLEQKSPKITLKYTRKWKIKKEGERGFACWHTHSSRGAEPRSNTRKTYL